MVMNLLNQYQLPSEISSLLMNKYLFSRKNLSYFNLNDYEISRTGILCDETYDDNFFDDVDIDNKEKYFILKDKSFKSNYYDTFSLKNKKK